MSRTLYLLGCIAAVIFLGCDSEVLYEPLSSDGGNVIVVGDNGIDLQSDLLTLNEARVIDNRLLLSVSYSGGCADHGFTFVSSSVVTLSNPPGIEVYVLHDAGGDLCEAYLTEEISVDLTPLIDQMNGTFWMSITVPHTSERIRVEYNQ